jgi:dolichol-phosphate mannosyltransferase
MTITKLLIFVPTYNEKDNIELLYHALKKLPIDADILFCDDNSPDGTGAVLDTLAAHDSRVTVMHRSGKLGLGTAHLAAFRYARAHGYSHLVTMDADFTHDPSYIPAMLAKAQEADVVIGSRYAQGGGMIGWGSIRLPFTYFWKGMIKYGLGLPYDATGAFRVYRVSLLDENLCNTLRSKQFSFNIEALYYLKQRGARIAEIPIVAKNRVRGASKLSFGLAWEEACMFIRLLSNRIKRTF